MEKQLIPSRERMPLFQTSSRVTAAHSEGESAPFPSVSKARTRSRKAWSGKDVVSSGISESASEAEAAIVSVLSGTGVTAWEEALSPEDALSGGTEEEVSVLSGAEEDSSVPAGRADSLSGAREDADSASEEALSSASEMVCEDEDETSGAKAGSSAQAVELRRESARTQAMPRFQRTAFPPGARSFLSCFFMLYSTSFHRDGSCLAENFRRGVLPQRKLSGGQSGHVRMAFPISRASEERSEPAISSKVTMPRPENHNFISVSKSITPADSMEYA